MISKNNSSGLSLTAVIFIVFLILKLTENIDWSSITETITYNGSIYKTYLTSCTYHCG